VSFGLKENDMGQRYEKGGFWDRLMKKAHGEAVSSTVWFGDDREKLQRALNAIDEHLGDTDPDTGDLTDDEIRDEYPVYWVHQQISSILT
jgi:hypothetical protein